MDRVGAAIYIEKIIQKYIKEMKEQHNHDLSLKFMDEASKLAEVLKDMGFKHGYREMNGKVAEVLIDTKENKFYKI